MDIRICVNAIDHINLVRYSSKFICSDLHFLFLAFIYLSVYSNTWYIFCFVYVIHHYSRVSMTFYQEYHDRVPSVMWLEDDGEIDFFHV